MPAMTSEEFGAQMKRLVTVYGATAYPEERLVLIWREVADFEVAWLAKEVDVMIGTFRQAPLLEVFAAASTKERERRWATERETEKVTAKNFFAGRKQYSGDDALRFQMVRDLLKPDLSDDSRASILAHFGPSDLHLDGHAAVENPKHAAPTVDLDPVTAAALAERQRRNLPYVDN